MRIEELKQKFVDLQQSHQTLREDKIRLESELKALDADYQEKLKQLLEVTNTSSYEEAVEFCKTKKAELDREMEEMNVELENYLHPEKATLISPFDMDDDDDTD